MSTIVQVNLGCGLNKFKDFVNIDIDSELKPDIVHDFRTGLPFAVESVDKIVMFHTIEHIEKKYWNGIFHGIHKVLRNGGSFYISFPEFEAVVENWKSNKQGLKDFWEATIYGRQLTDSDYHVAICSRKSIANKLKLIGFSIDYCGPEPIEDFNSLIKATRIPAISYEDTVNSLVFNK